MALEVKVFKDIHGYESKPMFGRSWRQLAAIAMCLAAVALVYVAIVWPQMRAGRSLSQASDLAMYVAVVVSIPFIVWGFVRPKGLLPEQFFGFVAVEFLSVKEIGYVDTYGVSGRESAGRGRQGAGRKGRRAAHQEKARIVRLEKGPSTGRRSRHT
ncbi:PrgI family protein (plasmid) [Propionibacterium freudenreichii]|uniref:PrgI family protein n=1 Tax=Propionibacterium freudenreichii TaxID=1744 RepID=UPI0021A30D73|nr:PrgI family protein [Propionibacterium freudenreichii]MCT2979345.1 PrgI family protein [Propionibacterium freudenreichii]MCT2985191.1 PrgI family protein [Propionibacterium freudenreichii]MCT3001553.1 PrgI family protein [Propionibacterium freudenreichii]MDK9339756.1 PrgI family protein [Propionibacterium freudenreichii]MDK9676542.1 PrgI family protein [Propionibacterium freudenreichii]